MSISINKSSEATTQFNHLTSCLFNISHLEGTPVHSFSSPRQGSVTVIGKKIFSNSCLSPDVIEENPKYPIPVKVMSRLKRQSTQAKNLIKQKTLKNLKLRCFDQPGPHAKTSSIANSSVPKISKTSSNTRNSKKKTSKPELEKLLPRSPEKTEKVSEKPPRMVENKKKSPKKLKKIIQMTVKAVIKSKKKAELKQKTELKKKMHKKSCMDEMNSKIRLENSAKFKKEKFHPKTPWGLDERKFTDHKEAYLEIEKQRQSKRNLKQSPEYKQKRALGLSKFFEIGEEIGLKRCASTTIKLETSPLSINRKTSNAFIQDFMKKKRKKLKEVKRNNLIEEVKKETKRIQNLKVLDLMKLNKTEAKKKKNMNGRIFRNKRSELDTEDELKKIYNEYSESSEISEYKPRKMALLSSEEVMKRPENISEKSFSVIRSYEFNEKASEKESEETEKSLQSLESMNIVNQSSKEYSLDTQNKAACLIQRFFKKNFLKPQAEEPSSSYQQEDFEVQEILSAWKDSQQQESSPKPNECKLDPFSCSDSLKNLDEMKQKELSEVKKALKSSQNPDTVESLTKMIGNRYEHIADLLQHSLTYENVSFPLDHSNSLNSYKQELEGAKENRGLDFSFPSYKSDKSYDERLEKGRNGTEELKISEESFVKTENGEAEVSSNGIIVEEFSDSSSAAVPYVNEKPRILLISRGSPIELKENSESLQIVTAADVASLSEFILSAILFDVIPSNNIIQLKSVEKCPKDYIDQLTFNISETNFKHNLKQPLYKDPLEMLTIMHCDDIGYPEEFYAENSDPVLPISLFFAVNSVRMRNIQDEEIKFFQKTHDKLVFDCCNEVLNQYRPFSIDGKPMPWNFCLKNHAYNGSVFEIMPLVANKLNKIDAVEPFNSGFEMNVDLNKVYLEAKIKSLIIQDIKDGESEWVNYEFESAQAKINAAELVLQILIQEIINIENDANDC